MIIYLDLRLLASSSEHSPLARSTTLAPGKDLAVSSRRFHRALPCGSLAFLHWRFCSHLSCYHGGPLARTCFYECPDFPDRNMSKTHHGPIIRLPAILLYHKIEKSKAPSKRGFSLPSSAAAGRNGILEFYDYRVLYRIIEAMESAFFSGKYPPELRECFGFNAERF